MVAFVPLMLSLKNTTKEKNSSYNHLTTKICNITAHWFFSLSENNSVLFLICIGNRFLECIFNVGWKCEELDEKETNISINLHWKKKKGKKAKSFLRSCAMFDFFSIFSGNLSWFFVSSLHNWFFEILAYTVV